MEKDQKRIYAYDTTLRDGAQGEGISFSVADKFKIATKLDFLGVAFIEGGWPGSNPKDKEFFARAQKELKLNYARLVALSATRRFGARVEEDESLRAILTSGVKVATLVGKSWDFQVEQALEVSLSENLQMIRESIGYLVAHGLQVIFDAEHFFDGYKSNAPYALETLKCAQEAGASWLVLCDTNGGCLPGEIEAITTAVAKTVKAPLGIHAHNDGELAVANTLAAVAAGARQVQGTINGYGERCGNANLCSLLPNLELKLGYHCLPPQKLSLLTEVARYVSEVANLALQNSQPFVGRSAFAHKAGLHASAVRKHPETYEHIAPEKVGNKRRILVSELAGQSNLLLKAEELNLLFTNLGQRQAVLEKIKALEFEGYQFEGADASLELMFRKALGEYIPCFCLDSLKVIVEKRASEGITSEAVLKLRVGEKVVHTAAEGNGPVNALDNALRKALEEFYPVLKEMHLADYKVRVIDGQKGTAAKIRVLIESQDPEGTWSTVGVSENIIEASWQALIDSMEYLLWREDKKAFPQRAASFGKT